MSAAIQPPLAKSGKTNMTKDQLPGWALRIVGVIGTALLGGLIAWMTYMSTQQLNAAESHAEMRTKLGELEKRIDIQRADEAKRYDDLREELHRFMERIEAKIDRLGRAGAGAIGSPQ